MIKTDSRWRNQARAVIAEVHNALPNDATLKDRIKAVDEAKPDYAGTSWPQKMWQKERRLYLIPYGYKSRAAPATPIQQAAAMRSNRAMSKAHELQTAERDPVTGRPVIR